jgi:hypothetical protein
MTEDESIKLCDIGNSFWDQLGKLAAKHIAQMPEELEGITTTYLQDKCSIYGTRYSKELPLARAAAKGRVDAKLFHCNAIGCCTGPSDQHGHKPLDVVCSNCGHQLVEVISTGYVFCSSDINFCGCDWPSIKEVPPGCLKT